MMTVKVGEVINQLRNIAVFGIVLCAVWVLALFNIEGFRSGRLLIQDYLLYLTLNDSINKAENYEELKVCLQDARIGVPCRLKVYHPWLDKPIDLDTVRLDVGQLEPVVVDSKGITKSWKSNKFVFEFPSNDNGYFKPTQFWVLRPAQAADLAEPMVHTLVSDYAIVVNEYGAIIPVSMVESVGDSQHKILRFDSRHFEEADAWLASLGQGYPSNIRKLTLQDPMLGKLVHDYYRFENMRETIAGLTIPLNYAPPILSALLAMSSILLIGIASALNMARHQASLLTEEYGWPLLYSGGGVTFILGLALALLALSVPGIAIYRTWVIAAGSNTRELALWVLIGSLGFFSVAICINTVVQCMLRQSIRANETKAAGEKREREVC
jgi:hypothetical protein